MGGFRANSNRCGVNSALARGLTLPRGSLVSGALDCFVQTRKPPTRCNPNLFSITTTTCLFQSLMSSSWCGKIRQYRGSGQGEFSTNSKTNLFRSDITAAVCHNCPSRQTLAHAAHRCSNAYSAALAIDSTSPMMERKRPAQCVEERGSARRRSFTPAALSAMS